MKRENERNGENDNKKYEDKKDKITQMREGKRGGKHKEPKENKRGGRPG